MTTADRPPPSPRVAVVLAGGDPLPPGAVPALPSDALVVAADSGLAHARVLGVAVHVVVGDLDSVDPGELARAEAAGAAIERHPVAKDDTDLALALGRARRAGVERIVVVGGHGGRLDHLLANALLLAAPELDGVAVVAHLGSATVHVVRPEVPAALVGRPGSFVSLLPPHGMASGVRTEGLRYPLHGEDLVPGSTRGVSNELVGVRATVKLADGVLLVVQPAADTDPGDADRPAATDPAPGPPPQGGRP